MAAIPAATAMAYLAAGLSCLPAAKARKHPAIGSWKNWQSRLPTEVEVRAWFSNQHDAICVPTSSWKMMIVSTGQDFSVCQILFLMF